MGVKLIAATRDDFTTMVEVAQDIVAHLKTLDGTKNIGYTAESTPGLFSFQFDEAALQVLGLTP
ncbi:MAG: hypothetical protein H6766_06570 [Candidatus Peribacteria bacterium]|nr:MAG: hypothetical protein H6766_06570 [Candidatus Peribacteria bacterium]